MPALAAVPGLVKVLLTYAAPGIASVINRIFMQSTGGSSSNSALNTAAQTTANSWATFLAPQSTAALNLIVVQMQDLSSSSSPTGIWTGSKPGTSGSGGAAFPSPSFIIKPTVADRYRGGHGRQYLPGIPSSSLSSNDATTWNTTTGAAIATAWGNFLGNIVTALNAAGYTGMSAAVPHWYKGQGRTWVHVGTPPNDYWKHTNNHITSGNVPIDLYNAVSYNDVVGSQRRRNHQSV